VALLEDGTLLLSITNGDGAVEVSKWVRVVG
jgi:hypothetical protein